MLFDSHAHINSERYQQDREALIREIEASDLSYVMDIGFDLASSLMAVQHAATYDWCYAAVGCHPHDAKSMDEDSFRLLAGLAERPKVQAIGETGLDYYYDFSPRDVQQHWFRRQIQLAREISKPIVIHDRDAHDDVLRILKEEKAFETGVLMHCYSGSKELAQQYVKLGATLSIAGPVTYKNARKTIEVVEAIPIDHLLVETDSPYLTPEPFRGKINKPYLVEHTVRKVAEIKGLSYEEAARITCENAKRFFQI